MRKDNSLSSHQDLRLHRKPGEGVSPVSAVPESGEAVSLSMAGFPGRWLEILCFLISFTPSTFHAGLGLGSVMCTARVPP